MLSMHWSEIWIRCLLDADSKRQANQVVRASMGKKEAKHEVNCKYVFQNTQVTIVDSVLWRCSTVACSLRLLFFKVSSYCCFFCGLLLICWGALHYIMRHGGDADNSFERHCCVTVTLMYKFYQLNYYIMKENAIKWRHWSFSQGSLCDVLVTSFLFCGVLFNRSVVIWFSD